MPYFQTVVRLLTALLIRQAAWRRGCSWAIVVILLAGAPTVQAATCSMSLSALTFSNLGFLSTAVDASSNMTISCKMSTGDTSSNVYVCPLIGTSTSGGLGASRTLTSSSGHPTLTYGLYSDSSRSQGWGDLSTANDYPSYSLALTSNSVTTRTITVYARVPTGQKPYGNDTYHDSPTVNLMYSATSTCAYGHYSSVGALTVTAPNSDSCTLTVYSLNFGNNSGLFNTSLDGSSSIQTMCTQGTAYTLSISDGNGPNATAAQRSMINGSNALIYSLYTDSARTQVWGDGTTVKGTGTGVSITTPVYARIPVQSPPVPGTYVDQVVVTVSY